MMLNEIIAMSNSSGKLSGTGRPQALTDVPLDGLLSFTEEPESRQQNFLSILSRLGAGTVQVTPEKSGHANPKLAEDRLPDGMTADDAFSEKPKGKQGNDGCTVNRFPAVSPDTLGIVMGILPIPDPPQSDLSAEPARHATDSENIEAIDLGSPVGKALPEMMASQVLSVNCHLKAGSISISPASEAADRDSAVRARIASKIPVRENAGAVTALKADLSGMGRVPAVPADRMTKEPGLRSGQTPAPEPMSSDGGQAQAAGVNTAQTFQGWMPPAAESIPEPETALKAEPPHAGRIPAVPADRMTKEPGLRSGQSSAPEPVSSDGGQAQAAGVNTAQTFQGWMPPAAESIPEPETALKAEPPHAGRIPAVPVEESAMEPGQRSGQSPAPELVSSDGGQALAAVVNTAQTFQGRMPPAAESISEPEMAPKAEPPRAGRIQAALHDRAPKLHTQRQRDPLSISDTANLNPLTQVTGPGLKEDQSQRLFAHTMSMDAAVHETAPTGQKDDPDIRTRAVKMKSASFYPDKDAVDTGKIAAASAGASNTDDHEAPNMFMAADPSWKSAGGEADALFQPLVPESGVDAVSFSREAQMEKISWVKPSSNELRPEGQSFHAEVLKQVVEKASTELKSGQSEIRIDLKPESLGHLRLHVLTDQQQVTVKILAENPQVKDMIENQASLIKSELQQQGIHVHTIKVDMLMSGGSDFAYSQHEGTAFQQARQESAYAGGKNHIDDGASKEPESLSPAGGSGGSLVNYFA